MHVGEWIIGLGCIEILRLVSSRGGDIRVLGGFHERFVRAGQALTEREIGNDRTGIQIHLRTRCPHTLAVKDVWHLC